MLFENSKIFKLIPERRSCMFIYPKKCVSEEHGSSHSRAAQGRRRHLQVALEAPQGTLQAEAARLRRTPRLHQGCHQTGMKNIPEFEKKT